MATVGMVLAAVLVAVAVFSILTVTWAARQYRKATTPLDQKRERESRRV